MADLRDPTEPSAGGVRTVSALVIAGVLLIAAGLMLIPLSKKPATDSASSTAPPSTTGVAPKPAPSTAR
jgi:hypothetical protein